MEQNRAIAQSPLFLADFPDPSVIYQDGAFYMTTTSMYFMPGIPVMRSYDLAHWEIISYVYQTFLDNAAHNLMDGQNIYGKGSWATSLRYGRGYYYVCFNSNDAQNTFIYRTKDIAEGPWESAVIPGAHHDPALLFDDDGRTYLIYGNGTIWILELTEDAMSVRPNGVSQILVDTPRVEGLNCEGSHIHKIDGRYYLMLIQWPRTSRRIQWCYRSETLLGGYTGKVIFDDDMGYQNKGVAQGGLICSGEGKWYAMLFQDRGAVGRCPVLLPVEWEDGWPVPGKNGKMQYSFETPYPVHEAAPFIADDDFDYPDNKLSLIWQWNHNPDPDMWSVTVRQGYLRLTNGNISPCFERARNTLTQHTLGPLCSFWTKLDTAGMKPGDYAGIAALQSRFGLIGVNMDENGKSVVMRLGDREEEVQQDVLPLDEDIIYLKVSFNFKDGTDIAEFSFSHDGIQWSVLGEKLHMQFRLDHFTGYRAALFSYATKTTGGFADFDFIRFEKR